MADDVTVLDGEAAGLEPAAKYSALQEYVPKDRKLVVNWPGLISVAGDRGYFPGCRLVAFHDREQPEGLDGENINDLYKHCGADGWPPAADQLNTFAQHYGNLAIVDWRIVGSSIYCLITTQLDGDQLEDFQFAGRVLEQAMRERRAEREEQTKAAGEAAAAKEREDAEALALGRKAKEHNLMGKLRDLEEENADMKRRLKLLIKKAEK
jgi:hypothetical protein